MRRRLLVVAILAGSAAVAVVALMGGGRDRDDRPDAARWARLANLLRAARDEIVSLPLGLVAARPNGHDVELAWWPHTTGISWIDGDPGPERVMATYVPPDEWGGFSTPGMLVADAIICVNSRWVGWGFVFGETTAQGGVMISPEPATVAAGTGNYAADLAGERYARAMSAPFPLDRTLIAAYDVETVEPGDDFRVVVQQPGSEPLLVEGVFGRSECGA
jgi:hypothetical protein